jgi:hypothetical protein
MVINITDLMWKYLLVKDSDNEVFAWLHENIGPEILGLPSFELIETGHAQQIRNRGEHWAITYETVYMQNPIPEHEWGGKPGQPWAALPYSKTISESRYYLHILDAKLAVMFKLRWL